MAEILTDLLVGFVASVLAAMFTLFFTDKQRLQGMAVPWSQKTVIPITVDCSSPNACPECLNTFRARLFLSKTRSKS
ncbi:MAG: hypothetical protein Q3990_04015 [Desulfovibrionaceae bacterium]|nr:hypothetical protein [Desulfovibrionaceae bacterium]